MKLRAFSFLVPLLLIGAAGCASPDRKTEEKKPEVILGEFDAAESEAVKAAAQPFAEGMFQALKEDQFALWQREIPATFSHKITAEGFQKMRAEFLLHFGEPERCEYIGTLDQGKLRDCLWKFRFVKTPEKGPAVPHEVLCWVRVYREEGKAPAVGGFGFQPF